MQSSRNVDDVALRGLQGLEGCMAHVKCATKIDVNDRLEGIGGHGGERNQKVTGSTVHHYTEACQYSSDGGTLEDWNWNR